MRRLAVGDNKAPMPGLPYARGGESHPHPAAAADGAQGGDVAAGALLGRGDPADALRPDLYTAHGPAASGAAVAQLGLRFSLGCRHGDHGSPSRASLGSWRAPCCSSWRLCSARCALRLAPATVVVAVGGGLRQPAAWQPGQ